MQKVINNLVSTIILKIFLKYEPSIWDRFMLNHISSSKLKPSRFTLYLYLFLFFVSLMTYLLFIFPSKPYRYIILFHSTRQPLHLPGNLLFLDPRPDILLACYFQGSWFCRKGRNRIPFQKGIASNGINS